VKPLEGGRVFVRMRMPCFRDCQIKAGVQIGGPNRIENVFELLDKPEEWYLDRRTRTIHYVPRPGQDKEGTCFVMPGLEKLLIIQGTSSDRVHGISFEGIVFADTTFLRPGISGHAEVQSNLIKDPANDLLSHSSYFGMPAAVTLGGVEDVSIRSCGFTRLGSSAIDIGKGSRRVAVEGNVIQDISGSGIQIGGFDFSDAHPADEEDVVERIAVMDNYIHHIGAEFKGSTGIIAGYARHLDIAHNEIHHVPYIGISVGWGWGYCDPGVERILRPAPSYYPVFTTPTIMEDNSIQYNWIHHAMQVMYDGGGIYTLSRQPGSRIAGNLLHDNSDCVGVLTKAEPYIKHVTEPFIKERPQGYPGGIYLDEGSEGFEVTDNVFYNVAVPINANPIRGDEGGNHIHGNRMGLPEEVPSREEMPEQPGFRDRLQQVLNRGGSCPD
jgi:hypothetical protein